MPSTPASVFTASAAMPTPAAVPHHSHSGLQTRQAARAGTHQSTGKTEITHRTGNLGELGELALVLLHLATLLRQDIIGRITRKHAIAINELRLKSYYPLSCALLNKAHAAIKNKIFFIVFFLFKRLYYYHCLSLS